MKKSQKVGQSGVKMDTRAGCENFATLEICSVLNSSVFCSNFLLTSDLQPRVRLRFFLSSRFEDFSLI